MAGGGVLDSGPGVGEPAFVVYPRRWKLALFASGSLAFVLAGLWIGGVFGGARRSTAIIVVATYVGVPFFALCFLYLLFRLVVRKPSVVVSEEGVLDNASALGAGMIRWEEIKDVRSRLFGTQRMIVIVLRDEQPILARQNPVKRFFMLLNKRLIGYAINIPENTLPLPAEELIREIKRYRAEARRR